MLLASDGWQEATISDLRRLLEPDPRVMALALFGTAGEPERDVWSDVDLLMVVEAAAEQQFHPGADWLRSLGELYAWETSSSPWTSVTRACFSDCRRIDFVITTDMALEQIDQWPTVPFWKGTRVLFSRSARVEQLLSKSLARPAPPLISDEQFQQMVDGFWFRGVQAVQKVMRDDRLIALHLALEMVQDCCVLGMLLRDRAVGTAHHRHGGSGNAVASQLEATQQPHTAAGILDSIEQSSTVFDELARQWSASYQEHRHPLLAWINMARRRLKGEKR